MNRDQPPSLLDINFPPPPTSTSTNTTTTTGPSNSSSEGIYAEPCSTDPLLPNHHSRQRSSGGAFETSNSQTTLKRLTTPSQSNTSNKVTVECNTNMITFRNKPFNNDEESHYAVAHVSSPLSSAATSPRPPIHAFNNYQQQLMDSLLMQENQPSHSNYRFIRRSNIQLVEKIGEGKFTHVYSCRIKDEKTGTPQFPTPKHVC